MSKAEELREALAEVDETLSDSTGVLVEKESSIFTAARERLAQLESNAMLEKVWWCVVTRQRSDPQRCRILAVIDKQHHGCGEKQLAPIDALVVVKENPLYKAISGATRVIVETDLECEHGYLAENHDVMDGAAVVAKCFAGVKVEIVQLSEILDALQAAQSGGE